MMESVVGWKGLDFMVSRILRLLTAALVNDLDFGEFF